MSIPIFTRPQVEKMIGGEVDPEVWDFIPWGHRIVVKRLPTPERVGSILIPENYKEPLACGWVIRVGLEVGMPGTKHGGDCPFDLSDLVGKQVMFGKFAGMPLKSDTKSDPFEGEFLVLQEDDIWGHINQCIADVVQKENA